MIEIDSIDPTSRDYWANRAYRLALVCARYRMTVNCNWFLLGGAYD